MITEPPQIDTRPEVIDEMRWLAQHGGSVRALAQVVQTRLGLKDDALLPILWYFMDAFCLRLPDVLPIREWLGTRDDLQIDAVILPLIQKAKAQWASDNGLARTHPSGDVALTQPEN